MRAAGSVLSREALLQLRQEAQRRGRRVVMTNGCFDLVHPGHIGYLEEASNLGDVLYVAVNSDTSVSRLKGAGRPINNEMDRALVLAALKPVDGVTIFDEDTATEIVEMVRPDIYVKGGDYSADPQSPTYPIEGGVVTGYGGRVAIIPFCPGYSTSSLLARIRAITSGEDVL